MIAGVGADILGAPLYEILGAFGDRDALAFDPGAPVREAGTIVDDARCSCRSALTELSWGWTGPAAEAALTSGERILTDALTAVERGTELAAAVFDATVTVVTGVAQIARLIDSFTTIARDATPVLALPQGQLMLLTAALEHLSEGLEVLTRVVGALTELTVRVTAMFPEPERGPETDGTDTHAMSTTGDDRQPRVGREIVLPDGSTAVAPNTTAAEAVRRALTQQGTPYVWGGTVPGTGLDCSGLTQWAYGQAGLDIPRLAQEQDVGARVASDSVLPGDLAVWDGHVAMVVGNGLMVEAGDPVSVTPIRTTNSGMSFQGFFRPTT